MPPIRDLAHNASMCSAQESNRRPLGWQAGAQSTEPHQPGLESCFTMTKFSSAQSTAFPGISKKTSVSRVVWLGSLPKILASYHANSGLGKVPSYHMSKNFRVAWKWSEYIVKPRIPRVCRI